MVFVYGSLKKGFKLSRILDGAEFVSNAMTAPGFQLFETGWFPSMIRFGDNTGENRVYGELYRVSEEIIRDMDMAEGHPNFFRREKIRVEGHGDLVWAYLRVSEIQLSWKLIENGVWEMREGRGR